MPITPKTGSAFMRAFRMPSFATCTTVLKPLRVSGMPLDVAPPRTTRFGSPLSRVHWVEQELVCEVQFPTWTADGLLRQVSYQGLRADKPARDVRRPRAEPRRVGKRT
jgi:ATP-dependent DNA ligase